MKYSYVTPAKHRTHAMPAHRAVEIAAHWVERVDFIPWLQERVTQPFGRRHVLTVRAVCGLLMAYTLTEKNEFILLSAARFVDFSLTPRDRQMLGLPNDFSYSTLSRMLSRMALAVSSEVEHDVDEITGEILRERVSPNLIATLCTSFVSGSVPSWVPTSETVAIDSTDYETPMRRQTWGKQPDVQDTVDHLPVESALPAAIPRPAGFPFLGPDGRLIYSKDPDARMGWRSGSNANRSETFLGMDVHFATDTKDVGGKVVPHITRGMTVAPAGDSKTAAGIALIDALTKYIDIKRVLNDRGYSYARFAKWAEKLQKREVIQHFDLHTNQRGARPGPIPGTIFVDGGIFLTTMPERLIDLASKSTRPARTKAELDAKKALTLQYEERETWAFDPFGKPLEDGRRRYRGPRRTGKVNCKNYRRGRIDGRPFAGCATGRGCVCGKTFTFGGDRETQFPRYGTQAHENQYGLRVTVESFNAEVKHHRGKLDRHFARVAGLAKNALILAMFVGGVNIRIIRDGYRIDTIDRAPNEPVPIYYTQEDRPNSVWDALGPLAARLDPDLPLVA